jgi:hypothetical protein
MSNTIYPESETIFELQRVRKYENCFLATDQPNAQFLIICLLQPSTCLDHCRAHHQEVKFY